MKKAAIAWAVILTVGIGVPMLLTAAGDLHIFPLYNSSGKALPGQYGTAQQSQDSYCQLHKDDPNEPGCKVQGPADRSISAPPVPPAPVPINGDHVQWMTLAGIPASEQADANFVITNESGWQVTVYNYQGSTAYGLCQALPGSKMANTSLGGGPDWLTNPITQLRWCNGYAHSRYGSWAAAKAFWLRTDPRPYPGHWW